MSMFDLGMGFDFMIMDSSARADDIIAAMERAAAMGFTDYDYGVDDLTDYDEDRVDAAYARLFGGA